MLAINVTTTFTTTVSQLRPRNLQMGLMFLYIAFSPQPQEQWHLYFCSL